MVSCEEMRNDLVDAVRGYYRMTPLGKVDIGVLVRLCEGMPPGGGGQVYGLGHGHGQWGGTADANAQGNGEGDRTARGNSGRNQHQNQNRTRNDNLNGDRDHNHNDRSRAVKTHKPNKLLELLVAQLTYKVLVRGWDAYKDSASFKNLMKSSIEVAMWHLDWLHRLHDSRYSGLGGVGMQRKRFKSERERDGEAEDAEDIFFENKRAKKVKLGAKLEGGVDVEGWENPAASRGCMFHEHKEMGSLCKTPDDLFDDE